MPPHVEQDGSSVSRSKPSRTGKCGVLKLTNGNSDCKTILLAWWRRNMHVSWPSGHDISSIELHLVRQRKVRTKRSVNGGL